MPLFADAVRRIGACWRLKAGLSLGLALLFMGPYFALQRVILFPVRTLPLSWIDQAIGFDPRWVWPYQSVYVLVAIVPWLAVDRAHLVRYARGFLLLSLVGFVCFLFFPVAAPRPAEVPVTGMFGWLVWYDGLVNCLPSLHVGLAVYTLLVAADVSKDCVSAATRTQLLLLGGAWVAAIAYAAVATKQHYAVDLPPGVILAWLAHRWSWAGARAPSKLQAPVAVPAATVVPR